VMGRILTFDCVERQPDERGQETRTRSQSAEAIQELV
jgi:hypothetical protein